MDATVKYPIRYGDRIFVRVMMLGQSVCELTLDRVADFTEVIGEIRHILGNIRGLATAIIRNYHRGWSIDRPLMFYGRFPTPRLSDHAAAKPTAPRRMLMPWETH